MASDFLKNIADTVKDKIGDTFESVKRQIVGKEVTVYPSYGYRDRADPET